MKTLLLSLLLLPINADAFWARAVRFSGSARGVVTSTGAVTTEDGIYNVAEFKTVGTSSVCVAGASVIFRVQINAGGGGGGAGGSIYNGAGGAGGMVEKSTHALSVGCYTVIIGTAGLHKTSGLRGFNGGNSSIDSIIAIGGGGGASDNPDAEACSTGGSGGACSNRQATGCSATQDSPNGGTGYGYAGGTNGVNGGGCGGGAGGVGCDGRTSYSPGGEGRVSNITGSNVTYSSGGLFDPTSGNTSDVVPTPGYGTGGYGGNCGYYEYICAHGSAGIVILRWLR